MDGGICSESIAGVTIRAHVPSSERKNDLNSLNIADIHEQYI